MCFEAEQGAVDIKKDDFDGVHKAPRFLGLLPGEQKVTFSLLYWICS